MTDAPERVRVAQDADGFWTCREAVSGSQEYIRADLYAALEAQLAEKDKEIAELIHDLNRIKDRETELVNDNAGKDRKIAALQKKANDWSMEADKYKRALDRCQARNNDSLSSDAIHAVREILKSAGVPTAAFIDDHVANAIVQRNQERTRAEAAEARAAELEKALDKISQWPDGGNSYGQENIKRFARTVLKEEGR